MCVGLHGLADERRQLQLFLFQWRPELGGQDDGGQGQRGLLFLTQPRLFLTNVAVDPPGVGHVLDRQKTGIRRLMESLFSRSSNLVDPHLWTQI